MTLKCETKEIPKADGNVFIYERWILISRMTDLLYFCEETTELFNINTQSRIQCLPLCLRLRLFVFFASPVSETRKLLVYPRQGIKRKM